MKKLLPLTVSLILLFIPSTAFATSIDGVWLRPKTKAHIKAFNCRGGLGLKVIGWQGDYVRGKTNKAGPMERQSHFN